VRVPLPTTLSGRTVRIEVEGVRARTTTDWYSGTPTALPIALAEVQVPGLGKVQPSSTVDTGCRNDLLTVDGQPVPVRIAGASAAALARGALPITTCDGTPLQLGAGRHLLEAAPGRETGLDLDRLVLRTAAWDETPSEPPAADAAGPEVELTREARGHVTGTVASDGSPFWLVVDQTASDGWRLRAKGDDGVQATVDGPHPVDGNAVGWLVTPSRVGPLRVDATWTPQSGVSKALGLSLVSALLCLGLVLWREPRKRPLPTPYGPPRLTRGPDIGWWRTLPISAATAVVAGLCVHPSLAIPTGLAMWVFASRPRWGRLIPPALVTVAALSVLVLQVRDRYPAGGGWPSHFGLAHLLTLMAVVVLGMEAIAEAARHRKARRRREAHEREQPPPLASER
jgi:arabinofuranan 3-O-arabinosyltransferase